MGVTSQLASVPQLHTPTANMQNGDEKQHAPSPRLHRGPSLPEQDTHCEVYTGPLKNAAFWGEILRPNWPLPNPGLASFQMCKEVRFKNRHSLIKRPGASLLPWSRGRLPLDRLSGCPDAALQQEACYPLASDRFP